MIPIFLEIINSDISINVNIRKNNNLLYNNKRQLIDFYKFFYDVVCKKENGIDINLNNKRITCKDVQLINLMDIDMIINSFNYCKGTLIYEYVADVLNNIDINDQDKLMYDIQNILEKSLGESDVSIEPIINDNIIKIINSALNINYNGVDYIDDIKILLENLTNNLNKLFIVFYDSDLIEIDEFKENVYYFDISQYKNLDNYNISLINEVNDFNFEILLDTIKDNWPVPYDEPKIKKKLSRYFNIYESNIDYYTEDVDEVILNKILNKIYKQNVKVEYNKSNISNNIKSFLVN